MRTIKRLLPWIIIVSVMIITLALTVGVASAENIQYP